MRNNISFRYNARARFTTSLLPGKLIGKNLSDFEDLRNTEVNEFRWKMKVFANAIAQERRRKL